MREAVPASDDLLCLTEERVGPVYASVPQALTDLLPDTYAPRSPREQPADPKPSIQP